MGEAQEASCFGVALFSLIAGGVGGIAVFAVHYLKNKKWALRVMEFIGNIAKT